MHVSPESHFSKYPNGCVNNIVYVQVSALTSIGFLYLAHHSSAEKKF